MSQARRPTTRKSIFVHGRSSRPRLALKLPQRKIPLEEVARFCGNMNMCLATGMTVLQCLRTCQRTAPNRLLKRIMEDAIERAEEGLELSAALAPWRNRFPAYFLPALQCGEQSGRLDQTLAYLQDHCQLLAKPVRAMRNMWLHPLCIMLFGSVFCLITEFLFMPVSGALDHAWEIVASYAKMAALVLAVIYVPQLRAIVDRLRLELPIIGPAQRELNFNRFFRALNMLYCTGGERMEKMIRAAAATVDNVAMRADFLHAAERIEAGDGMTAAFTAMPMLPEAYRSAIATGDEAGKLEDAFESICKDSAAAVADRVAVLYPLCVRLTGYMVMTSVVMTLMSFLMMRGM